MGSPRLGGGRGEEYALDARGGGGLAVQDADRRVAGGTLPTLPRATVTGSPPGFVVARPVRLPGTATVVRAGFGQVECCSAVARRAWAEFFARAAATAARAFFAPSPVTARTLLSRCSGRSGRPCPPVAALAGCTSVAGSAPVARATASVTTTPARLPRSQRTTLVPVFTTYPCQGTADERGHGGNGAEGKEPKNGKEPGVGAEGSGAGAGPAGAWRGPRKARGGQPPVMVSTWVPSAAAPVQMRMSEIRPGR